MEDSRKSPRDQFVHDVSQPVQAIEMYAAALERRVESEETVQLVMKIREAVAELRARIDAWEG